MARAKGPIYKEENVIGNPDLLKQLREAIEILEEKMKANIPITKGTTYVVGYGINKAQRGIAADAVISIVRAIKSLRGW